MPVLTSESIVGQSLTAFFGWDPMPDLLEFVAWAGYLIVVCYIYLRPVQPAPPAGQPVEARG